MYAAAAAATAAFFYCFPTLWCKIYMAFNANGMFCHWSCNYHWIRIHRRRRCTVCSVVLVDVVWATLSAIDSTMYRGCIARLSAPANSDRLLSFQFMLCPCEYSVCTWIAWVRTCSFHVPHRFCFYSTLFPLPLSLSTISVKMHLHFVVLTSLLHLHYNNAASFLLTSKFILVMRNRNGSWMHSTLCIMYTISNSVLLCCVLYVVNTVCTFDLEFWFWLLPVITIYSNSFVLLLLLPLLCSSFGSFCTFIIMRSCRFGHQ